jgi:hypothetical protein
VRGTSLSLLTEEFASIWGTYDDTRLPSCAGPGPHAIGSRRRFQLMDLTTGHLVSPRCFCSYRCAAAWLEARPSRPDSRDAWRIRLLDWLRERTVWHGEIEQPAR